MSHKTSFKKTVGNVLLSGLIFSVSGCAMHNIQSQSAEPHIVLQTQGSFTVGGTTVKHSGTFSEQNFLSPDGQTAYGDHAYVFYQIPVNTHKYPLVFQHGGAQTKRTWESTPDGRDGFQNIFLKKTIVFISLTNPVWVKPVYQPKMIRVKIPGRAILCMPTRHFFCCPVLAMNRAYLKIRSFLTILKVLKHSSVPGIPTQENLIMS